MNATKCVQSKPVIKKNSFKQRIFRIKSLIFPPVKVTPLDPKIKIIRDLQIPMRDGLHLKCNIYLPQDNGRFPVLMSLHPYCKDNLPKNGKVPIPYRLIRQTNKIDISTETGWEAPDPNFWVQNGYIVINIDKRGFGKSPGEQEFLNDDEAQDYYDAIEWVASQPWSNGKVGLLGVSYLAISQYKVAALNPPHLKAICPWEGFSDAYKDAFRPGGIREDGFIKVWSGHIIKNFGLNFRHEQLTHKLRDSFYTSMVPDLSKIKVPALICGSFSDHLLHSRGSFRAFEQISSPYKWLYTHRSGKWATFYSKEAKALQLQFFDYFLKENNNEMLQTPPIHLEIRESNSKIYKIKNENQWPSTDTKWTNLYLDPANAKLRLNSNDIDNNQVTFCLPKQSLTFNYCFENDIEISGPMKLELYLSSSNAADLNLFIGIQKFSNNKEVCFEGSYGFANDIVTKGFMKPSLRKINSDLSKHYYPEHDFQSIEELKKDEIVKVEISLLPSATLFKKGDTLRLVIQGRSFLSGFKLDQIGAYEKSKPGNCTIYSGKSYPSLLLIPITSTS